MSYHGGRRGDIKDGLSLVELLQNDDLVALGSIVRFPDLFPNIRGTWISALDTDVHTHRGPYWK